ncbi:hypothetical protein D3C86_562200 [compost metagenome]
MRMREDVHPGVDARGDLDRARVIQEGERSHHPQLAVGQHAGDLVGSNIGLAGLDDAVEHRHGLAHRSFS